MERIDLMSEILSNETIVSNIITDISKNITPLKQNFNFNTDSQTTLLGNSKSHELNNNFNSCIAKFAESLEKDVENLKSISKNFKESDKNISESISK